MLTLTVNNLGPQTSFPVPEGILNHNGENWLGLTLWTQGPDGASLGSLELVYDMPVMSGSERPQLAPQPKYSVRRDAY